jgi:hypothetical protein
VPAVGLLGRPAKRSARAENGVPLPEGSRGSVGAQGAWWWREGCHGHFTVNQVVEPILEAQVVRVPVIHTGPAVSHPAGWRRPGFPGSERNK